MSKNAISSQKGTPKITVSDIGQKPGVTHVRWQATPRARSVGQLAVAFWLDHPYGFVDGPGCSSKHWPAAFVVVQLIETAPLNRQAATTKRIIPPVCILRWFSAPSAAKLVLELQSKILTLFLMVFHVACSSVHATRPATDPPRPFPGAIWLRLRRFYHTCPSCAITYVYKSTSSITHYHSTHHHHACIIHSVEARPRHHDIIIAAL